MPHSEITRDRIQVIVRDQALAVLATTNQGKPHPSLIGFTVSDDLTQLVFATSRSSLKFKNIVAEPEVALLVDTRQNRPDDFFSATAISIYGTACEIQETELTYYRNLFLDRHPQLRDFVFSATTALIKVNVTRYKLISEFEKAAELLIRP